MAYSLLGQTIKDAQAMHIGHPELMLHSRTCGSDSVGQPLYRAPHCVEMLYRTCERIQGGNARRGVPSRIQDAAILVKGQERRGAGYMRRANQLSREGVK